MSKFNKLLQVLLLGCSLFLISASFAATPASDAQKAREMTQPSNNAPVWRSVNSGVGTTVINTPEAGVLIQVSGHQWRLIRNGVITVYGGWLIAIVAFGIALAYLVIGPSKLKAGKSGSVILRFTPVERYTHWALAVTFILLAISGVVILWGRYFLLPLLGGSTYGPLLWVLKNVHNLTGPLFTLCLLAMFVTYVRDNIPSGEDFKWMLSMGKNPAHRFNGGEKAWFWIGVVGLGLVISVSGWILDSIVPGVAHIDRSTMQISNIVHGVASVIFIAMSLGHMYVGTVGMEGSYDGMKTGYVDENWAKEHHELWYKDVKAGGDHTGRRSS